MPPRLIRNLVVDVVVLVSLQMTQNLGDSEEGCHRLN